MKKSEKYNDQPKILTYHISSVEDIVNKFSPDGFELLSDNFLSFMNLMLPDIPKKAPILLEITGAPLKKEEQESIDMAIWLHYRLIMTNIRRSLKACKIKIFWFILATIVSGLLLYLVNNKTSEVVTQLLYLPIWFFGYRILIFALQEYLPKRRELEINRRLASLKLVFSEKPMLSLSGEMSADVLSENEFYYDEALDEVRNEALIKQFTKEDGSIVLTCKAGSAKDLISTFSDDGCEMISTEFMSFLQQAEPFVNVDKAAELNICGSFSDEDKSLIQAATENYFKIRHLKALQELETSRRKIYDYLLGLIGSSILLYMIGNSVGLALHEFILIVFWFFGDYLIEFILFEQGEAKYNVRLSEQMLNTKLHFK